MRTSDRYGGSAVMRDAPSVHEHPVAVSMGDTVVLDGSVPALRVGDLHRLPLAVHRRPSLFASPDALDPVTRLTAAGPSVRRVRGRVAVVDRHRHGGALVLVDEHGAGYAGHLQPDDPAVEAGARLELLAEVSIDPYAWFFGPSAPDSERYTILTRVVRIQQRTAPLAPLVGEPGTWRGDWSRADVVDLDVIAKWHGAGIDRMVDYVVWLRAAPGTATAARGAPDARRGPAR